MKIDERGVTLLEILFSIAILAALSLIGVWHWSQATAEQALVKDRQGIVTLLAEARSLSIASKNALPYGVHFEEDLAVLFEGATYDSGNPNNRTHTYNSKVHMDFISLEDTGSDIVFSRLNGAAENSGTMRLSLRNDPMSSTTITVQDIGVIE